MRKTKFSLILAAMVSISAKAQNPNPFKSIGKPAPEILSLSNGKYPEIFENDTLRKIGSVMFNTRTNKIAYFIETDTMYSEATLRPEIVSRWLSRDPLARKYPSHSPYNFAINNPIYWIDPDGQAVKPSTGSARSAIQTKIDLFNSNETLSQIFANASYTLIGTYNDPNGGSSVQGAGVNAFSLSGVSYAQARRILNNDNTGLSAGQKLEALAWVRALSALDVAEVGVYDNTETISTNNSQGQISDNTFLTSNEAMRPFMNATSNAASSTQKDAAIDILIGAGSNNTNVPFLENTPPSQGTSVANITSNGQTLNIVGLYPVDAGNGNTSSDVSKAVQNFGVSRGTVSVSDDKNRTQLNSDLSTTVTPR